MTATAARADSAQVPGISLVTNPAAGLSGAPIQHDGVLRVGRDSTDAIGELLARLVRRL